MQFFIPFAVYSNVPPHLSPIESKGQKQNRQLNSSEFGVAWQGKYLHEVLLKNLKLCSI